MVGLILLVFAFVLAILAAARVPNPWFDNFAAAFAFFIAYLLFSRGGL